MTLWIALFLILVATLAVLLRPLATGSRNLAGGDDREVYAAQLEELEADKARGAIGEADAAVARTEIARRLLRAKGVRTTAEASTGRRIGAALAVALFTAAFSLGAYAWLGMPGYGDQPLAARLVPLGEDDLARMVAQAEAELAANPDDGRGWIVLAPIYQRMRRFADAAHAYERANALLGENADWLGLQGENLAYAGSGAVSEEARALFERALALDPQALRPAIFLAIADRQQGDNEAAGQRWQALLARAQGNEPWLQIAQAELTRMGLTSLLPPAATGAVPGEGAPPPAMVEAMVSGLAQRLESEGGTVDEWVRLVRSYTVLGRMDDARATVSAGLAALTGEERAAFQSAPDVARLTP